MSTLGETGEREAIRRLTALLPSSHSVLVGAGDDAAVVRMGGSKVDLVLTSDPLTEGVHFTADDASVRVGHKAMGRVLSDLAAMGAKPRWALINVAAPPELRLERIEGIYRGAAAVAGRHGLSIVGGDTSRSPVFALHVFGVGEVPAGSAVTRAGAREKDPIYVTGELGGSRLSKHLDFEPRVAEGVWLREQGWAKAMIDITDGLATDLRHILERSGVGAELLEQAVPIAPAARAAGSRATPLQRALTDGEDFELLFTIDAKRAGVFEQAWGVKFSTACTRIGCVTGKTGVIELVDPAGQVRTLEARGFEHFRS